LNGNSYIAWASAADQVLLVGERYGVEAALADGIISSVSDGTVRLL
jgi:hypothetical protein